MMKHHRTARHRNGAGRGRHKRHTSDIGDNLREIGQHIQGAAQDNYEEIRDRAADYYEQGREQAREWEDKMLRYVRTNPLQSVLIAAGVGMLLGRFWHRR